MYTITSYKTQSHYTVSGKILARKTANNLEAAEAIANELAHNAYIVTLTLDYNPNSPKDLYFCKYMKKKGKIIKQEFTPISE